MRRESSPYFSARMAFSSKAGVTRGVPPWSLKILLAVCLMLRLSLYHS